MNNPRISIALPTFNHAMYLADAINSAVQQTYQNFELIIIDDGSTDNTPEIIASILDPRIRSYRIESNSGATSSWNTAMSLATGDYCCQLDADDTLPPNSLELRINAINEKEALFSSITRIEEEQSRLVTQFPLDNPKTIGRFLRGEFIDFNINIPSLLFKRKILTEIGFRTNTYSTHADYEFCLKILLNYQVITLEKSTYNYIQRPDSLSHRASKDENELALYRQLCDFYAKTFLKDT